jgi:hypothetical protein
MKTTSPCAPARSDAAALAFPLGAIGAPVAPAARWPTSSGTSAHTVIECRPAQGRLAPGVGLGIGALFSLALWAGLVWLVRALLA